MKKTLISLSILLCSFAVTAKDWVQVNPNNTNSKAVKMLSTNDQTTILEFNLDGFSKEKVILGVEDFWFGSVARNLTGDIKIVL